MAHRLDEAFIQPMRKYIDIYEQVQKVWVAMSRHANLLQTSAMGLLSSL